MKQLELSHTAERTDTATLENCFTLSTKTVCAYIYNLSNLFQSTIQQKLIYLLCKRHVNSLEITQMSINNTMDKLLYVPTMEQ